MGHARVDLLVPSLSAAQVVQTVLRLGAVSTEMALQLGYIVCVHIDAVCPLRRNVAVEGALCSWSADPRKNYHNRCRGVVMSPVIAEVLAMSSCVRHDTRSQAIGISAFAFRVQTVAVVLPMPRK